MNLIRLFFSLQEVMFLEPQILHADTIFYKCFPGKNLINHSHIPSLVTPVTITFITGKLFDFDTLPRYKFCHYSRILKPG